MSLTRRVLILLLVLGALANFGAGTEANFTATTTNDGATFVTGSLVLSDKVGSGTACLSTGGGNVTTTNVNTGCDAPFNLNLQKPGSSATADLDIANVGSLDGTLALSTPGCTSTAVGTYYGNGNLCDVVRLQIMEYPSASARSADTRDSSSFCRFGGGTANSCTEDATKTLTTFASSHTLTPINAGTLAAGATKYYRLFLKIDSSVGNDYQGRQAATGLSWTLTQT